MEVQGIQRVKNNFINTSLLGPDESAQLGMYRPIIDCKYNFRDNHNNYIKLYNIMQKINYLFGTGAVNAKIAGR